MSSSRLLARVVGLSLALLPRLAHADALAGSPSSMMRQHAIAVEEDYSFLRTARDVSRLVERGGLVTVADGRDYTLSKVSFPYARPEVKSFVEHFAALYRAETGGLLVVTSLTRPATLQPRNAHKLSVHPAGMAVDFRVPTDGKARAYLERALLDLERQGILDVTRERSPAHYHVAVFDEKYAPWAARQDSITAIAVAQATAERQAASARAAAAAAPAPSRDATLPVLLLGALALAAAGIPVLRKRTRRGQLTAAGGDTVLLTS